ncbi:hypothetical protein POM88_025915 [Heracleum sosnowskyi]|uniref:Uncharacterized protein n=1 Tax=Heracleum sosnowskyi TaxID=360622 RepID=A0AAD8MN06_9APIA|nr:hypothetical protein POM88_025915 [Heracleum sosnowskyi]
MTEYDIHLVGSRELTETSLSKNKVGEEITVETCQVEPLAAQRVQDLTDPAEIGNLQDLETRIQINEQRGTSTNGIQGVEIIKSIVYGGDLKLLAVAAVALLGIIILAAGKAYVQRAPRSYVKTIAYYVVTALMASGVSYVAGDLINMFLEKFGVFHSSLIVTAPETPVLGRAWASF